MKAGRLPVSTLYVVIPLSPRACTALTTPCIALLLLVQKIKTIVQHGTTYKLQMVSDTARPGLLLGYAFCAVAAVCRSQTCLGKSRQRRRDGVCMSIAYPPTAPLFTLFSIFRR